MNEDKLKEAERRAITVQAEAERELALQPRGCLPRACAFDSILAGINTEEIHETAISLLFS